MPVPRKTSAQVIAALYRRHRDGAKDVDPDWIRTFEALDDEARAWLEGLAGPSAPAARSVGAGAPGPLPLDVRAAAKDSMRARDLIRAYRVRGHLEADLDPLGLVKREPHADLQPGTWDFAEQDLDRPIYLAGELGLDTASVREIQAILRRDYCSKIGFEFMHLQDPDQKDWLLARIEGPGRRSSPKEDVRRSILDRLTAAETFEHFLDKKYTGVKRFGLDGSESTIVALEALVRGAAELGIEQIVLGMAHRGRLNVLANVMQKPLAAIFTEFQGGSSMPEDVGGSGDVKYHLGTSTDRSIDDRVVHLSLMPNPSHLEAINPVVRGQVRARQKLIGDDGQDRCMGLLLHGDASFAGQGLVAESLQFVDIDGYRGGGCLHLIINNQIGFTTNPIEARSSPYCSDVAKMIQAPILHVNGDDPEAVVLATDIAIRFRQTFKIDVVIDLYCYRRFGHNEGDEPAFTQPLMYKAIAGHKSTRELYATRLVEDGLIDAEEAERLAADWDEMLEREFERSATWKPDKADWLEGHWSGKEPVRGYDARRGVTEASPEVIAEIGRALMHVPDDLKINRKLGRLIKRRQKIFETGEGLDWGTAEALAFGCLMLEGHPVRLSGEDSTRGTFSHRHAGWIDQEDERQYVPLNHIRPRQELLEVLDSPLSEFGVMGFEYGYAMADPNTLVLWEAQFGDFANGAQVIIDQFLAAGESKWLRMNGLVLLLPHGYEGQGPEHSSARLERFLQLCAEDNLQVVNCSTPASYFHVLRRQMHRDFRKPLIVMSPKSLLRHKRCVSKLSDIGPGTNFHRVLHENTLPCDPAEARQIVLCTGKVYYDLLEEREKRDVRDVHLLRVEQLYPFPTEALLDEMQPYRHCKVVWCQEEPRNAGAWGGLMEELLEELTAELDFEDDQVRYAGRESSASPATGLASRHHEEQAALVDAALTVGLPHVGRLAARRGKGV